MSCLYWWVVNLFLTSVLVCFVFVFCFVCSHPRISSTVGCRCLVSISHPSFAKLFIRVIANKTSTRTNPTQSNSIHPSKSNVIFLYFRVIWYAFSHSYVPWHPLVCDFSQRKTLFDAIVVGRWPVFGIDFFMYAFICENDPFPCLITVVLTL